MQTLLSKAGVVEELRALWGESKAALRTAALNIDVEYNTSEVEPLTESEQKALLLLHVKGALPDASPWLLRATVLEILRASSDTGLNTISNKRYQRLVGLIDQPKDATRARIPADVQSFDAFCDVVPAWKAGAGVKVFFRDVVPGCLVQRVQLGNLCYMHGSDVVLHYAACKTAAHKRAAGAVPSLTTMVDLNAFMLRHMDGKSLWRFVWDEDGGGNSQEFLARIAVRDDADLLKLEGVDIEDDKVEENLDSHGPALVSRFKVFDGFALKSAHLRATTVVMTGRHAMVVVGWRRQRGELRLLLQNWWKGMQFFECDLAFLRSRGGKLSWLRFPVTIQKAWPQSDAIYAETHLECQDCEMSGEGTV